VKDLIQRMRKGDRRALSRLLSYVEDRDERAFGLLEKIWPLTGKAYTVGVTGLAGAGKSTIIDQLILVLRDQGKKVGVVAVDPSSPFSGGAVLGDRIRMQRHSNDPDVFIRSVGSRGRSGGLSFSTRALVRLLDAFGTDVILLETVGAGQGEVAVADLADTTVVVLMPEAGDSVQTLKAGILEIADIVVVNKKDRPGADSIAREIESSLPPGTAVVMTEALQGEGIPDLADAIENHRNRILSEGVPPSERLRRNLHELAEILEARITAEALAACRKNAKLVKRLSREKRPNLYTVAEDLQTARAAKRRRAGSGKHSRP
jgi:LAO/AO transport system kinase